MNRKLVALLVSLACGSAVAQSAGLIYPVAPPGAKAASGVPAVGVTPPVSPQGVPRMPVLPVRAAAPAAAPSSPVVTARPNPDGSTTYSSAPVSGAAFEVPRPVAPQSASPVTGNPSLQATPVGGRGPDAVVRGALRAQVPDATSTRSAIPSVMNDVLDRSSNKTRLTVSQGVTEVVKIARIFPNRFLTPFSCVDLVTTEKRLQDSGSGGVITLATQLDRPIGVFLQDCDSDRAISLTLLPEDIPQRELRLVLDDTWDAPTVSAKDQAKLQQSQGQQQSPYVDNLKQLLKTVAAGEIPDGHVLSAPKTELAPDCRIPGVTTKLGQILEGTVDRIAVYVARNDGAITAPIQEQGCYMPGVQAVGAYPTATLDPGAETELFVVIRKDKIMSTSNDRRRPTLVEVN